MKNMLLIVVAIVLVVSADFFPRSALSESAAEEKTQAGLPEKVKIAPDFGNIPIHFEQNVGQVDARIKYLSRGTGYSLFLTGDETVFALHESTTKPLGAIVGSTDREITTEYLRMKLEGSNSSPEITPENQLEGETNYFVGSDENRWKTNIASFRRIRYSEIYDGIDVVYYGKGRMLEYDFIVAPHANPKVIALNFGNAKNVKIDTQGDLIVKMKRGFVRQHRPLVYQEIDGERRLIDGRYVIRKSSKFKYQKPRAENRKRDTVGFIIGAYDKSKPLVIDPVLSYSTYLGGSSDTYGTSIAVDSSGNAYVAGYTSAADFPLVNPFQSTTNGQVAFVTKLNPSGTAFVYSTYLGSANTLAFGIKVDPAGNAFVAGTTQSDQFPTTAGAYLRNGGGGSGPGGFVSKLSPNGSSLVYSTYLASPTNFRLNGELRGIAIDPSGNAYVTGATGEPTFPTTAGAIKTRLAVGTENAFVTKLNAAGSALVYSTFVGVDAPDGMTNPRDGANAIAVDSSGNAYITGITLSQSFPVTPGAFQSFPSSLRDAFVTKINSNGTALAYSTYFGSSVTEAGASIAVDSSGNAYMTGTTFASPDFPLTPGAFRPFGGTDSQAFLTKFNPAGTALAYSTFLDIGTGGTSGLGVAVDSAGNAYVVGGEGTGATYSINPVQPASNSIDTFIIKMNPAGTSLAYSTPLGGATGSGTGSSIAIDTSGNAYVTGQTTATDFPVTPGAPQATNPGGPTNIRPVSFIAKIGILASDCPAIEINPQPLPAAIFSRGYNRQLTATGGAAPYTYSLATNVGTNVLPVGLTLTATGAISGTPTTRDFRTYFVSVKVVDANGCVGIRPLKLVFVERQPILQVNVVGRNAILRGRDNRYTFVYTNNGDADAHMVPLFIRFPKYFRWQPNFRVLDTIQPLGGAPTINYSQLPLDYESGDDTVVPLILPRVRARSTGSVSILLSAPVDQPLGGFRVAAQIGSPLFDAVSNEIGQPSTGNFLTLEKAVSEACRNPSGERGLGGFDSGNSTRCLQSLTNLAFSLLAINPALNCELQWAVFLQNQAASYAQQVAGLSNGDNEIAGSLTNTVTGAMSTAIQCAVGASPVGTVLALAQAASNGYSVGIDCSGPLNELLGNLIGSLDPNDKIGALGFGSIHYLNGTAPLPYLINFENISTATAPAQDVVITDQLDVSKFDLNSFSLGDITIGNRRLSPEPGKKTLFSNFDLRPANNLIARINANLDTATGIVTWRFVSINPATGLPTDDPLAGILPPNTISPRGEGSVSFNIKPRPGLATGTEIRNAARIFFDTNPPIDTPVWLNTIDTSIPTSRVQALPVTSPVRFTVNWGGTDTGSNVQSYTIYVSDNNGPFVPFFTNTTSRSGSFDGQDTHTYRFFSIARDAVGNEESAKTIAEATTTVNAARVGVSGLVLTPNNLALRNAVVTIIDSTGTRRTATTSSFGIYQFDNVLTGQSYTITVSSRRYRFSPRIEAIVGAVSNLDFVGLE